MSTSNKTDFLTRLNEQLPLLSTRLKDIIREIYQNSHEMKTLDKENHQIRMNTLDEENHPQKREKLEKLFHDLLESLQNDLFDLNNRIEDNQIDILWTSTKLELEKFERRVLATTSNVSATTSNVSAFDSIFVDLIGYIETAYNIMQAVFKHLTAKTNQIIEKNHELSNEINASKTRETELKNDLQAIQTEFGSWRTNFTAKDNIPQDWLKIIQELQQKECERSEKEKKRERKMLIRDLFIIPKEMLAEHLEQNNLSEQMDVFVQPGINCDKLKCLYPDLFASLAAVGKQFALAPEQLLHYLHEKKNSNYDFHMNVELRQYAQLHKRSNQYSLSQFLKSIDMDPLMAEDAGTLQVVFEETCRIINQGGK